MHCFNITFVFLFQTRKNLTTVDLLQYAAILNESSGVATDADVKLNVSMQCHMGMFHNMLTLHRH